MRHLVVCDRATSNPAYARLQGRHTKQATLICAFLADCFKTQVMADPNTKINSSVGGPESATAQSSNIGAKGTSAGKGLDADKSSTCLMLSHNVQGTLVPDHLLCTRSGQSKPRTSKDTWGFRVDRRKDRRHKGSDWWGVKQLL